MHWHGYLYRGAGDTIKPFDDARRPGGVGFETTPVPPEATCAWLAKPARFVQGTWDEAAETVAWLRAHYEEIADSRMNPEQQQAGPSLETMMASARESLQGGNDVVWAWWLRGGNFIDLTVVCCPNRDGEPRCPMGRTDQRS